MFALRLLTIVFGIHSSACDNRETFRLDRSLISSIRNAGRQWPVVAAETPTWACQESGSHDQCRLVLRRPSRLAKSQNRGRLLTFHQSPDRSELPVLFIPLVSGSTSIGIVTDASMPRFEAMTCLHEHKPQCAAVMEHHRAEVQGFCSMKDSSFSLLSYDLSTLATTMMLSAYI